MITEQELNQWITDYDYILRYVISIGLLLIMVFVSFVLRYGFSMVSELENDEVMVYLLSVAGTIVSIPFVCSLFILLGMFLKWIFVK